MLRLRGLAIFTVAALGALPACGIDAAPKVRKADAKAAANADAPAPAVEAKQAPAPTPAIPAADPAAPLGEQFPDPTWYRKTIFSTEQGKAVSTSRSEADELGRFKSHMVFELNDLTAEQCINHLSAAVKPTVANLEQSEEADGRQKLSGSTDRYNVTLLCGEAKGTMRAYVAYEWTK